MAERHFSHVCCCIDGEGSGTAMAEAVRLAGPGGRVSVVHVAPPAPVMVSALSEWGEADPGEPFATPWMWLERTAALGGGEPVLLEGDPPAEVACAWARGNHVELMIASARAGGMRRRVLGRFTDGLADGAPCPVLVLADRPAGDRPPAEAAGPFGHVAALSDGSAPSLAALDAARRMVRPGDGRISVVVFADRLRRLVRRVSGSGDDGAHLDIERAARHLTGRGPRVLAGRPGDLLAPWVREAYPDLVTVVDDVEAGSRMRRSATALAVDGFCPALVVRPEYALRAGALPATRHGGPDA